MLDKLVEIMLTQYIRGAITHDQVDALLASEDRLDFFDSFLACYVALDLGWAFNRLHLEKVNRDEMRLGMQVDAIFFQSFADDLWPWSGCCTQVHDFADIFEDIESLVDLKELVCWTRPVAFFLGLAIVNVALILCSSSHL